MTSSRTAHAQSALSLDAPLNPREEILDAPRNPRKEGIDAQLNVRGEGLIPDEQSKQH